ncbi:CDP-glycerol glycerophosphotransferase family protein [Aquisediminimonas sediminicola]|uniref:CDP-glycerol glycerophosphotransferase family protein n=1 Tax=Alteraquisediminimonas sediminicola TaxID=2676787 RepID=UPI001C8E006F|nr:CDP-glycerol glycerophosphotransferase family protein [Aquisediminimonas sediminicola]
MRRPLNIGVSLIGGRHQYLHIVPVVAALSRKPGVGVTIFVLSQEEQTHAEAMLASFDAAPCTFVIMEISRWMRALTARLMGISHPKLPALLQWARAMRRCDAILTSERTTTVLKSLPGACPALIHIPHGAGDRAKGFEKRIKCFDLVIVAGPKDKRRMIDAGVVRPDNCLVSGYIKLAAVQKRATLSPPRLFDNDRKTILYNAHFAPALSSWDACASALIKAVKQDGRYNLIVAPHVRMFENEPLHSASRSALEQLAEKDRVIIDLGSERCSDMTYTNAADLYIGDVSSQVYEFAAHPRPCIFINAHHQDWENDPDYAMWRFGAVIEGVDDIIAAIDRSFATFSDFEDIQRQAILDAFNGAPDNAPEIAADQILDFMHHQAG